MKKYFVLVSTGIGGAERRFFDIFNDLRKNDDSYFLILPYRLAEQLNCMDVGGVIVVGDHKDNLLNFIKKYYMFLNHHDFQNSSFHYPINCLFFLHFFKKHKVSMSLTNCYYVPTLFSFKKSLIRQYISILFVDYIDVLSPPIYKLLLNKFSKKISLTPNGTYIKSNSNFIYSEKRNNIGFLGRLIDGKGLEDFIDIYEDLWLKFRNELPKDFCFLVAGYGENEKSIKDKVDLLIKKKIPIKFLGYRKPEDFLSECKVILSLQRITNYPSRVVAESLLSGSEVILRNSGNSSDFGSLYGLHYISEILDYNEIGKLLVEIFTKESSKEDINLIVGEARDKFSNNQVLSYFDKIMN